MASDSNQQHQQNGHLASTVKAEQGGPVYVRTFNTGQRGDDIAAMRERRLDANHGKRCFVIMPFGTKVHPYTGEEIDFDAVYSDLIVVALDGILDAYSRSDSSTAAGLIHSEMISDILSADVAIVDITTANPNVLYELGVRHAAKRSGTVVIKRKGDQIPFNIGGIRAFEYPNDDDPIARQDFIELLRSSIQSAINGGEVDSLVHGLFRGLNVTRRPQRLRQRETFVYRWPSERDQEIAREICIITGDIADITDIDVWVNPENTAMQMGRFYDNSISATIRYFGATRDKNGFVTRDRVGHSLYRQMKKLPVAEPGAVLVTHAGSLKSTNGVKRVLHVAAQLGEPSKGYMTVRHAAGCVSNCLRATDHLNRGWFARMRNRIEYDSILIPLFGTRSPDRIPEQTARDLIEAAVLHFEKYPDSLVRRVYFSAYSDVDLALCEQAVKFLNLSYVETEPEPRLRHRRHRRRARKIRRAASPRLNQLPGEIG